MATEFEDMDLDGAVFWGVSLRNATFRDVDLTGANTHHAMLDDVHLDGFVDRLIVNDVDVTDYVNARDPWQPLRGMLRPTDADSIRAAWAETRAVWADTLDRAAALSDADRRRRVDGEWSFVETLRHLVFVTDKWINAPMGADAFDPIGLPNSGSADFPWPGIDRTADPTYEHVLAVRNGQIDVLERSLRELDDAELSRSVEVPENGTVTVLDCWHTIFEEEFEHRRYALRDLDQLRTD